MGTTVAVLGLRIRPDGPDSWQNYYSQFVEGPETELVFLVLDAEERMKFWSR